MALSYSIIFAALAFTAVVIAGPGGRHGHGGGGYGGPQLPPFLQNVTAQGRQAFMAIVTNTSLTIAETETQVDAWAATYGVTTQVNDFKTQVETKLNEIKANVTAVVNNLPTVQTQLEAIFNNKSQTIIQQFQAIGQLAQQYPEEVSVLFFLVKPKGGFGQQGPFGGFPGNNGGFPGDNQGGFPGNQGGNNGGFPGNNGGFPGNNGGFPGGNNGGFPGNQGGNQGGFPGGNQGGFPGNNGGFQGGNQGGNQGGFPGGNQGGFGGFGGQQGGRGGF
ncbi:hypothetical protein GCK72_014011 [Caenorhabditis remanei]|uniref:SXP/RAL-2 family protein Ani s 5-like cation-binding domain-containing protein n=1 Tax=Caenorhabditis remanei TaxID=31234 RepID=A0A6A5GSU0_CAERE|nr:hypothetical protein GCK72_014011 [Caenorhabditis remanei]KAF1757555.1 hypothetical protein GCK72_014011 [Caenorhabditis remanei]